MNSKRKSRIKALPVVSIYSKISGQKLIRVSVPVDPNLQGDVREKEISKYLIENIISWEEE